MNLDEAQKKKVAAWIADGLKLSEIQNRIASELGVRLTYMEVRLLADDLKLMPKDVEPPKEITAPLAALGAGAKGPQPPARLEAEPPEPAGTTKGVSVSVDHLARPGAVVSGKVTFSDGIKADWLFDQNGKLGLAPQKQGYRPTPDDLRQFQTALESELSRLGL